MGGRGWGEVGGERGENYVNSSWARVPVPSCFMKHKSLNPNNNRRVDWQRLRPEGLVFVLRSVTF